MDPAVQHVHRDPWIRHMFFWQSDLPHEIAHGSLRLTLGEDTTKEDIDYVVDCLKKIVARPSCNVTTL